MQRAADIIRANRVTFAELSLRTKKSSVSINPCFAARLEITGSQCIHSKEDRE